VRPSVALLPWGDAIEDFLDPLGVDLAGFRDELTGGWLFGYVEALRSAGVDTTVVVFSRDRPSPARWRHGPTGAELLVLPVPRAALALRAALADPLAWSAAAASRRPGRLGTLASQPAHQLAPYLATPLRALGREARRGRWRAIICQEYELQRFDVCVALGRALGIPVFASFQGGTAARTGLEAIVRSHAVRACAGLIIAPRAEAERVHRVHGVDPRRIAEIANPVDARRWSGADRAGTRAGLGIPDDAVVVVWHGRVEMDRKGLDVLLDAWALLAARPELPLRRLLLIGAGRDDEILRARLPADALWVDRYVLDASRRAALLAAGDVYAFPSRHEGFAVAPLEAMASGLPVVAARAPGIEELLPGERQSGGLVVATGDAGALAAALGELLSDRGERERLGRLARRRAKAAFSPEAVGRRLRRFVLREV
jgi:glycosyltransferase involved in cell wall biosynthesis